MDARANWPALLSALLSGESLTVDEAAWAMNQIMSGDATPSQVAGFVVALRGKGETVSEVAGMAAAMLDHATPMTVPGPAVDVVGTGGDRAHTVNISTMAAIVTAATGARVVKHGNRAASSQCGTADVLEALGVVIDLPPPVNERVALEAGIAFCFAPIYHPAMKHAVGPRRELGVPTVFNFLGPLTNPARPIAQAIGCYDARMAGVMAGVFAERGARALVFRSDDGLDELTTTSTATVWVVQDGTAVETVFDPSVLDIPRGTAEDLRGADAAYNASVVHDLLRGRAAGPVRDTVLLNAAAAVVALDGPGSGEDLSSAMGTAYARAAQAVDSGRAAETLDRWIEISRTLRPA